MNEIIVNSERSYSVVLDTDFTKEVIAAANGRDRIAIIHSDSMKAHIPTFTGIDAEFFYFGVPDGEAGKSFTTVQRLWDWLGAAGFTRSDLIIGIGGGAVTDLSGFVAATWLRGLDWIAIPTTVAGMVDAAIGGKTGINSDYGKNLIGSFHSPSRVIIDLHWLESLTDRDFSAGLAEVIKCGFIADPRILTLLTSHTYQEIRKSNEIVLELIERSVKVKADVVSGDFKESFAREILNYGHTFGHAVELDSQYSLRHGEAVAIGMAYVAHLAHAAGILSQEVVELHLGICASVGFRPHISKIDGRNCCLP